jgi:hypothetical protein
MHATIHSILLPLFLSLCILVPSTTCKGLQGASEITIGVQFGTNVASVVADFATSLLRNATSNSATIQVFPADVELNSTTLGSVSVVLSFGLTQTRDLVVQGDLDALGSEGYIIRSVLLGHV